MDNNYISFRRAKVGGFNKKDVINYIEKMRNEFYDYKKAVEATVESLNDKIRELEALNDEINASSDAAETEGADCEVKTSDPISDINASAVRLRMVADELCKNLTDFMGAVTYENTKQEAEKIERTECNCADDKCSDADEKTDKAAEILARSVNFGFLSNETKSEQKTDAAVGSERKSVLDSLSSSAFFN